ncbi:hypothetical protein J6590_081587 [Homalodisca vitripennis]|nr:hypothetical protein J6590_081587 [Homalodisca vitripennis]
MCKLNPRESCRDAFREHGFLTLPCLYILDVALYCRFRCELVRGRDVHRYDTRGGDSYRMQHHRTLASEQLPSQAGRTTTLYIKAIPRDLKTEVRYTTDYGPSLKHTRLTRSLV